MTAIPIPDFYAGKTVDEILGLNKGYATSEEPRVAFAGLLDGLGYRLGRGGVRLNICVRVEGPGDRKGKLNGWYVYREFDDINGGVFGYATYGSWKTGEKETWSSKRTEYMSGAEREHVAAAREQMQQEHEEEQRKVQAEAVVRANEMLSGASVRNESHAYLVRKGVAVPEAVRQLDDVLLVPMYDGNGVVSLQRIHADGSKRFLTGGKAKAVWFVFQGDTDNVYVTEGVATGASIHMATGATVYCCFMASNLYEVTAHVQRTHNGARIIIAGDDDRFTGANTGRTAATKAAETLLVDVIFPVFGDDTTKPTDFNDLHTLQGLDELKLQLASRKAVYRKPLIAGGEEKQKLFTPPGIMRDMVNYYHLCSPVYQPGFAVMAAIALCSVVCGRNFKTSGKNFSSLYLCILGETGSGKEDAKRFVRACMKAGDSGALVHGSGYTSSGSVNSLLVDYPRHVMLIDEFSKYMQTANNVNSTEQRGANKELMEVITELDTEHMSKAYSGIGLSKAKRKELRYRTENPAITLFTMSTPEDMFENITMDAIKDGFWNRFIMYVSEEESDGRRKRVDTMPVPDNIAHWIRHINARRGTGQDIADETPKLHTLAFTDEAEAAAYDFETWTLERREQLKEAKLDALVKRTNEFALRLALICALAENADAETVEARHVHWAGEWLKFNLNTSIYYIQGNISSSEFGKRKADTLNAIRRTGEKGISRKEIHLVHPMQGYDPNQLKQVLDSLIEAEQIFIDQRVTGKPGPNPMVYKARAD